MSASALRSRVGIIDEGPEVRANRLLNVVSILVPIAASLYALAHIGDLGPTLATAWSFLIFFLLELGGIGIGMHRYFTHRAFKTGSAIRWLLAVTASWAFQGPIDRWVADHRLHHRFTDQPLDPHSPHWVDEQPPSTRLGGLLHAHIGWMFTCALSDPDVYASDIRADPITRWCSENYWTLCASSVLLPALVGFVVGGPSEALRGLLWAGFFRVALLQQLTWAVNSIGHSFGERLAAVKDESRNIPFFAVILFGEGLHSYHHLHPTAAVNEPRRLDLNGQLLILLQRMGLVWDLRRFD